MSVLSGKKILLEFLELQPINSNISSILFKAGAHVQVIMTPASKDFVTPPYIINVIQKSSTFQFYNQDDENEKWNNHVELALWADLMVIAPAANNCLR
jgi:phosphopantothenoylcysteine decarboxylase/phosphopantothenate--cysteine ligase